MRRLAAVLAADVVGYSRLMEVDEAGTLARLKTVRLEVIDPAVTKCRGRIIKTTGDGMLVEFQSVTALRQSTKRANFRHPTALIVWPLPVGAVITRAAQVPVMRRAIPSEILDHGRAACGSLW